MLAQAGAAGHFMVKKEDIVMSDHALKEAQEDGISENEAAEAITRGPKVRQNGHFITTYKYFTVVYKEQYGKYKIITIHAGYPRKWKKN